ncbi:hypothetical protein LX32DRAFT_252249 [Colletotrichum zoysiae]|uniref:Uncharacterized protein n=1 Tax=Colletotrichum zoysiae TaxID=1216348 RepID=A0AAD9H3J0_9PEZI|nr:hypothetical protein LX32DRAFT_252249 [Colletotrichum zoysiae]
MYKWIFYVDKTSCRPQMAQMAASIGTLAISAQPVARPTTFFGNCHSLDRPCVDSHTCIDTHLCCTPVASLAVLAHQPAKPRSRRRGCKAPSQRIPDGVAPPVDDHLLGLSCR